MDTNCPGCGARLARNLVAAIADPNQPESCPRVAANRDTKAANIRTALDQLTALAADLLFNQPPPPIAPVSSRSGRR